MSEKSRLDVGLTLEQLIGQGQRIEDRLAANVAGSTTSFQIGLVVLGLGIAVAGRDASPLVFLPVPFVLSLFALFLISKDEETLALAAWQRQLEERIGALAGEKLLIWETEVAQRKVRSVGHATRNLAVLSVAFTVVLWVVAVVLIVRERIWAPWFAWLYGGLGIGIALIVGWQYRGRRGLEARVESYFERTSRAARELRDAHTS